MTIEEAKFIIEQCKDWNTGQTSLSKAFGGPRTEEDEVLDAKRFALKMAFNVISRGGV